MVHETRLVPIDGSSFNNVRSYNGDSRGHWEGDTLVVETRNFDGKAPYRGAGVNLRLTERYTRVDRDQINYEVTMDDPKVFTKPWTLTSTLMLRERTRVQEYVCAENNQNYDDLFEAN